MDTVALHTRLHAGREADYERLHAVLPPALDTAMRAAGVRNWRIWRSGQDIFHLVECDDYVAMRAFLRDHPANIPWQARMGELFEVTDDYSGNDHGIDMVWTLPKEPAEAGAAS